MNIYCIKCLMFTKKRSFKIKRKIDGKVNLYSRFFDCNFEMFEAIDELRKLNLIIKQCYLIV